MKKLSVVCLALVFSAGAVFAADTRKPGMKGGAMMQEMMKNPHHKLAMAYKKNLLNFANTLKADISSTGKFDKNLAETAVKEMRESLDQVKKHHDEAKGTMSEDMRARRAEMIKMMEDRMTAVRGHLDNLEKEVKADTPDVTKVRMELDQIVKQCEMMKMKEMHKKRKMS